MYGFLPSKTLVRIEVGIEGLCMGRGSVWVGLEIDRTMAGALRGSFWGVIGPKPWLVWAGRCSISGRSVEIRERSAEISGDQGEISERSEGDQPEISVRSVRDQWRSGRDQ